MNQRNPHAARASERKAVRTFWTRIEAARQQNIEAARIISADQVLYPAIMQDWASRVLANERQRREAA